MRRLRSFISETRKIAPPHIVYENEYDIWLRCLRKQGKKDTKKNCYEWIHGT